MSFNLTENRWGESFIDELHRNEFVERNSHDHYERYPVSEFSQADTLFILVGSDSGLLLKYAKGIELGSGSRIVVIEPDDIYDYLVDQGLVADFINTENSVNSIGLYRQSNWYEEVFDNTDFRWFSAGQVIIDESQCSINDYLQRYLPLANETRRLVERRDFENRVKISNKDFIRIQIKNAADNSNSVSKSETFGKGYTAVVLGGGPSLDDHLDWIKAHQHELFIITVSRLCQRLQSLSLKPDVVVNIDPYVYSYDASKHGLLWDDVTLVSSFHSVPALMQQWRGPSLYLGDRLPWARAEGLNNPDAASAAGPTVGHTAINLAAQLGFSTILLSGMDHCYNEDLNTHAKGTPESIIQKLPTLYDAQVETYAGRMAGTQEYFVLWLQAMENMGLQINEHSSVVFNMSENAAKVESIPYKPMSQVTLSGSKPDIGILIDNSTCQNPVEDLNNLSSEIKNTKREFRHILKFCEKAQKTIDQIYSSNESVNKHGSMAKLDKLESRLTSRFATLMKLIRLYALAEFSANQKPSGFSEMADAAKETWIRQYYGIISVGAKALMSILDDLEKRIEIRQREHAETVDFDSLLDDWEKDNTPGRILRYFDPEFTSGTNSIPSHDTENDRDDKSPLSASMKERFAIRGKHFLEEVTKEKTLLAKQLKSHNEDIAHNLRTLLFLFNSGSSDDLELLITNLSSDKWPANVLATFCRGLAAELRSDSQSAVAHFQQAVDLCGDRLEKDASEFSSMLRLLEESLARMTQNFMILKDYSSACETLGMLCEMLPRYIVSYAKLLNLTGNTESATQLLNCYIENFPHQWRAATVLADIYEKSGQNEQAKAATQLSETMRRDLKRARTDHLEKVA